MEASACVIGLGRIGLPIALVIAKRGWTVHGVDIDEERVKQLGRGEIPIFEPGLSKLLDSCRDRFTPTTDLENAVERCSVILCCVGTRRFAKKRPDLRLLNQIFRDLSHLKISNKLIILKTTVPIGTTRGLSRYLQGLTRLRPDKDFFMAFSPERFLEGNAVRELETLPVIVGAVGQESLKRVVEFYKTLDLEVLDVGAAEAAELIKLMDNTYRITRFAFANEISLIAERLGLNAFDLIDAANYHYPRNSIPYPTCGVSGYCLTKDPSYLEEAFNPISRRRKFPSIWLAARRSYDLRTRSVVTEVSRRLGRLGLAPRESRVLVCGVAFKSNIDDVRDSHGLLIANQLHKRGMRVSIWDPHVTEVNQFRFHQNPAEAFRGKDAAIFTVAHREFVNVQNRIERYTKLMRTPLIYDGAGIFRGGAHRRRPYTLIGTGLPRQEAE